MHGLIYKLKNKRNIWLAKINYDKWKQPFKAKIIDVAFNSAVIAIMLWCFQSCWLFLKAIGVSLFFILLLSYVKDFKKVFAKGR